ncbi:hypothetical protein LTR70_001983 [Exophiala xenobiotica]|uniref:BTB domain-containing protein n=1 Tax=Lithohypha guttulata TaxID=1690604 RepID=A0ABR0JX47_9EURO|nr:hypothetical protein LTR24_009406 [Lithohypha guttulata]KAK5326968.1 hypothetical protein LTR70_001983 [Exophiala xenobiotica]
MQRCGFFKAACDSEFKESKTATITLDNDVPDGVDMLLVYLYTLELPNLANKQVYPQSGSAARDAYFLGDKYNLPCLRDHGRTTLIHQIRTRLNTWYEKEDAMKERWIRFIGKVWKWTIEDSDQVREAILDALMSTSQAIIEDGRFQALMKENEEFLMAFLRALAKKAIRK